MVKIQPELTFKALADQQRLRILSILMDGEICVGDLVDVLGSPQPTVSRHLAVLRDAGLVVARKHGLWVFHSLCQPSDEFGNAIMLAVTSCATANREMLKDRKRAKRLRQVDGCCPGLNDDNPCGKKTVENIVR